MSVTQIPPDYANVSELVSKLVEENTTPFNILLRFWFSSERGI
jgi:hypothetical protein